MESENNIAGKKLVKTPYNKTVYTKVTFLFNRFYENGCKADVNIYNNVFMLRIKKLLNLTVYISLIFHQVTYWCFCQDYLHDNEA